MTRILRSLLAAIFAGILGGLVTYLLSPARAGITWETASEIDTAGFYIYRSDTPDGDFVVLNESAVPTAGDPLLGASYRYEDQRVSWGKTYFYQLEEVELDGDRFRFPNTIQSRAGLGWGWAIGIGISFALLAAIGVWPVTPKLASRVKATQKEQMGSEKPPVTISEAEAIWIDILSEAWSGPVKLSIQGRCMWPALQPGDQVTVEPVKPEALMPGSWVVMRRAEALIIHRFLGIDHKGQLLTKGDRLRQPDAPWSREALVGLVVAHSRQGQELPVQPPTTLEKIETRWQRSMCSVWPILRRIKRLLPFLLLLICAFPTVGMAAVTILSYTAETIDQSIHITWETGSEIDMLGFYIQRSLTETVNYLRISGLIVATGDPIVGKSYEYFDMSVEAGNTYYYQLEAVDLGGLSTLFGPISATLPANASPTPTATPSATATETLAPTPTVSPSPTPSSTPQPSNTPLPTATWLATPSRSLTPAYTATSSTTPSVKPSLPPSATISLTQTTTPGLSPAIPGAAIPGAATQTPSPMPTATTTATPLEAQTKEASPDLTATQLALTEQIDVKNRVLATLISEKPTLNQEKTAAQHTQNRVRANLLVAAGIAVVSWLFILGWAVVAHRRLYWHG